MIGNVVKFGGATAVGFFLGRRLDFDDSILPQIFAKSKPIIEDELTPSTKWDYNWDKMQPEALVKPSRKSPTVTDENNNELDQVKELPKSTATRHIIMIRHGQYNLNGVTDEEKVLTALGERQAHLTGERLKDLDIPFQRLVYSTMTRATQTANCIREHLGEIKDVTSSDLLREGAPFPTEPPTAHWKPERAFHVDGARIEAAFRTYFHRAPVGQKEDSYELVVCHANVIRYFVCRALQFPPEGWLRMGLHNGSITHMVIRPSGRVSLRQYSDVGYMPKDAISST